MSMSIELTKIEKEWIKTSIFYMDRNKRLFINDHNTKNSHVIVQILDCFQEPLKEILFKNNKKLALLNLNNSPLSWVAKAFLLGHKFKIRRKI